MFILKCFAGHSRDNRGCFGVRKRRLETVVCSNCIDASTVRHEGAPWGGGNFPLLGYSINHLSDCGQFLLQLRPILSRDLRHAFAIPSDPFSRLPLYLGCCSLPGIILLRQSQLVQGTPLGNLADD